MPRSSRTRPLIGWASAVIAVAATALVAVPPANADPVAATTPAAPDATAAPPGSAPATTATGPAGNVFAGNDYCLGQCADILPPGQNGNAGYWDIIWHQLFGSRPAHSSDQLDEYANLVYHYADLTDEQIATFFNDASFGVPAGQVESTLRPRQDVTIVRDKATGVPHITGTTRSGTMFGAGYAGAQDRLWVMDVLRHAGRGRLSSFAGGAPGNRELEQSIWRNSPYTEADLQAQVDALAQQGTRGQQLHTDVRDYIAGVNAYIDRCVASSNCPGEYSLTGNGPPRHFTMTDLIATAGVIGGLFGGGGGEEIRSALVRVAARAKFGTTVGDQVWRAFRAQNDPETVLTLHDGQSFPYGDAPAEAPSVALPDAGSVRAEPVEYDLTGGATASAGNTTATASAGNTTTSGLLAGVGQLRAQGMSNAVVISGAHSTTGNPIAVFGPQTGYFAPQLLMLQELQGPGISARGAAFAGLNLYVLLGRGQDYAWSATSAGQDITDTYAVPLCTTDGSTPTLTSEHYRYHGQCLPMERLDQVNSWSPSTADPTPAGSYTLRALRTRYGLVAYRGIHNGQPVAFTRLRSTYRHEADSAIGFQMYNDPAAMGSAADFRASAARVGYAFNWFYVNSTEAAYYNSGLNPVRPAGADPNLPMKAEPGYEWVGWDPVTNTATYTPDSAHPQSVNQDYYISWNNKQARDYSAADGNFSFGSVHRGQLLDAPVHAAITAGQKLSRADVVRLTAGAGVTDLRGQQVLDELLRVLKSAAVTDPTLADAVNKLRAWRQGGALRKETSAGSRTYQHAEAIQIFDAWWPLLVSAQFRPGLGADLYARLVDAMQVNEAPSGGQNGARDGTVAWAGQGQPHKGSAFQQGWWGYVDKDLRGLLGDPVAGGLGRIYCGDGSLAACRQLLLTTLGQAVALPAGTVYPGDAHCAAGNQWCADAIVHQAMGGITHPIIAWQNRPTFHQVVSFPARRGDSVANLAFGRPATASSTQALTNHTPGRAVDGDLGTRWSSSYNDNQWIRVDLGASRTVSRVVLRWEAAYGSGYRIEVSADGGSWQSVFATTTGDGGVDNVTFAPVTARYIRMYGTRRATSYGFSLYEFEAYSR